MGEYFEVPLTRGYREKFQNSSINGQKKQNRVYPEEASWWENNIIWTRDFGDGLVSFIKIMISLQDSDAMWAKPKQTSEWLGCFGSAKNLLCLLCLTQQEIKNTGL